MTELQSAEWSGSSMDRSGAAVLRGSRLTGVDAARGVALIGMMAVHMLPSTNDQTGGATVSWWMFSGNASALFALLAGVGLGLSTGGTKPHEGRKMTADRVGLLVRAVLIAAIGLMIGAIMPTSDAPTESILLYYGAFFVLAIPFLGGGPRLAFGSAAILIVVGPVLIHTLTDVLPEWTADNPTLGDVIQAPAGTVAQLLVTGTYPAAAFMVYVLVGLGIARLDLSRLGIQRRLLLIGLGLAAIAQMISAVILYAAGGYRALLREFGSRGDLHDALIWGPDWEPSSWWWLGVTTPHANMPLSILSSLGLGVATLGAFLLLARVAKRWLVPLSAMGAMTLTLYTAHLVVLTTGVQDDYPYLSFWITLLIGCVFAIAWLRKFRRGPLEQGIHRAVNATRRRVNSPELSGA